MSIQITPPNPFLRYRGGFKTYWGMFTKSEIFGIFRSTTVCNSGPPKVLPRTSSVGMGAQGGSGKKHRVD